MLDDIRRTLKKAKRSSERLIQEAGREVAKRGRRVADDVVRRGREAVGDVADTGANMAKEVEELISSEHGDRKLKGFPRAIQVDDHSCGAQSTMAILEYFGFDYVERQVKKAVRTTKKQGTTEDAIVSLLEGHGLACSTFSAGRRDTIVRAIKSKSPVLVELDGDHYGVVYGYGRDRVFLADPAPTRSLGVVVTWREFNKRWDKAGVVVSKRRSKSALRTVKDSDHGRGNAEQYRCRRCLPKVHTTRSGTCGRTRG